jgi:flap endonuclease-1
VGTDYNPGGVRGIGPKTALKMVKEKPPEKIFGEINWEFAVSPYDILDFFRNPPAEDMEIRKEKLRPEKVLDFLAGRDFSRERIENTLKKLVSAREEQKQKGLEGFLGK